LPVYSWCNTTCYLCMFLQCYGCCTATGCFQVKCWVISYQEVVWLALFLPFWLALQHSTGSMQKLNSWHYGAAESDSKFVFKGTQPSDIKNMYLLAIPYASLANGVVLHWFVRVSGGGHRLSNFPGCPAPTHNSCTTINQHNVSSALGSF
jgi:hypothetical protein